MLTVLGVLATQLLGRQPVPIDTNILALLPENRQDPAAQAAFDQVASSMSNKVVFVVGSDDPARLFTAADAFTQQLSTLGLLGEISGKISQSQQQAWGKLYFPHRAQFLTPEQQVRLQTNPAAQVQQVIQAVYNPFSGVTGQELAADPFLLFREFMSHLTAGNAAVTLQQGYLTAPYQGKTYVLISADLAESAYSMTMHDRLPALAKVEETLRHEYGVSVLHTGVIFYAAHGTNSAKGEISTIGVGSLLGVIALLLLVYRSALPLGLALLSIGCGLLTAFVATVLVFGKVHLFSLVFGASLIGVSIDYALHFLTDRLAAGKQWHVREGVQHIVVAVSLGLLMSLIGYLCMMIAPFPGLQQLSLFSAVGLAAAYATVMCWYPVLAARPGKVVALPWVGAMTAWLAYWAKPSVRCGLPLLCIVVALVGLFRASYDDDIRQLQALPADLKQQEETIKAITGLQGGQQMLLVQAATEQALLEQLGVVDRQLTQFVQQGALSGYQSLHTYLPSAQTQADNYDEVERLYQQEGARLSAQLQLKQAIALDAAFVPLTPDAFLASPASAPLRFLWLGNIEGHPASVVMLKGIHDASALQAYAASEQGVTYLDKPQEVSAIFAEYRVRISELLLAAMGVIYLILVGRYGWVRALRVIAPPVIACFVGLGITGFTGTPLNLFNLLGLFLILGIGIDYTLFFAEQGMAKSARANSTLLAITLSALTTLLSFGLLALSETQAIHSFGITVLTGILTAWLLAPLSLPQTAEKHATEKRKQDDVCLPS
ncbi:MMPL family transporter [Photobacterium japonica]